MPSYFPDNFPQAADESLRWTAPCPNCQTDYTPVEARIVAEKEGGYLLFHECDGCRHAVVSAMVDAGEGITTAALITDLTYHDITRFRSAKPVSSDDVLEAYVGLRKHRTRVKSVKIDR